MSKFLDFLLQLISQFAGGPGPMENNLVRFSIPAVTYGALMIIAWSRQRKHNLPREKLLVWGFGLGSASAILMAVFASLQMLDLIERESTYAILVPVERSLMMAAIIVIAGAFLRYILDDERLTRTYLLTGLGTTFVCLIIALWQWPRYLATLTEDRFHTTTISSVFQIFSSILIIIAIVLLRRKNGWLSNVVTIALLFFLAGELLFLVNYATDKKYSHIVCPIGNSFPILAIPLLGYVYLREQTIDRRREQKDLEIYRYHLEDLVAERTAEISMVNANLAAQNAIAATLSQSLDLKAILDNALNSVLSVVGMEIGFIFLWDAELEELPLQSYHGPILQDGLEQDWGFCKSISIEAMQSLQAVVHPVSDDSDECPASIILTENLKTLVSVPLVSKGRPLGALTLGSKKSEPIQKTALEFLTAIGQQIGMATENSHLYQSTDRVAEELTLLHQISTVLTSTLSAEKVYDQVVELSAKLLNCQTACILNWDEEEQSTKCIASYGITEADGDFLQIESDESASLQNLIHCREAVVIGDTQIDPRVPPVWAKKLNLRVLLCVPIQNMNESFGALFLMDRRSVRRWRYEEIVLIESFVNRAAVALMNANLHKQLEWAAALEERQRIAADMHDGLAQTVSLLGLQIDEAMELIMTGSSQKAVEELAITRETIKQVSVEVRRSIASLQRTPQPRRSLQESFSNLPQQLSWKDEHQINFIFKVQEPLFLPQDQENEALFVVQEALLNAHRHAHAQQITVTLEHSLAQGVSITIEDDGTGFELGAWWENSQGHFGLGIMYSRAARIGATLRIDSAPGHGTQITLTWPQADRYAKSISASPNPEFQASIKQADLQP